ncbi:MAG: universal stress protein, partial [Chitinophagaceae bacterium]
ILIYGEQRVDDLLVFSQVILSLQLGFAVIPLIHFVSDKQTMGVFAIKGYTKVAAWLIAIILVGLNVKLVADESIAYLEGSNPLYIKIIIILFILAFIWLFTAMTFLPIWQNRKMLNRRILHQEAKPLTNFLVPELKTVAIALDFTDNDEKLIAHALQQGKKTANYLLMHVVESASATYLGNESDDAETRKDRERLEQYAVELSNLGYTVQTQLGFRQRKQEIVRIVKENKADMLVMGAHRHTGLKDYLFGETIEAVRHELNIQVLIVSV